MKTIQHRNPGGSLVTVYLKDGASLTVGNTVTLGNTVRIVGTCVVGNDVTIDDSATLMDATVGAKSFLGISSKVSGIIPARAHVAAEAELHLPREPEKAAPQSRRCFIHLEPRAKLTIRKNASGLKSANLGEEAICEASTVAGKLCMGAYARLLNMGTLDQISRIPSKFQWDGTLQDLKDFCSDFLFLLHGTSIVIERAQVHGWQGEVPSILTIFAEKIYELQQALDTAEGRARAAEARVTELEARLGQYGSFDD